MIEPITNHIIGEMITAIINIIAVEFEKVPSAARLCIYSGPATRFTRCTGKNNSIPVIDPNGLHPKGIEHITMINAIIPPLSQ